MFSSWLCSVVGFGLVMSELREREGGGMGWDWREGGRKRGREGGRKQAREIRREGEEDRVREREGERMRE